MGLPSERSVCIRRIIIPAALLAAILSFPADAHARRVHWKHAGASVFGGACEYGTTGYRGDYLPSVPMSFAELGMGSALGGLPYLTRVRVLNPRTHRRLTIRKRDIGGGGGNVNGVRRGIDMYEPALTRLLGYRSCNWTGVLLYRRV